MGRLTYIVLLQFIIIQSFGQKETSFIPPVKIPIYLSGNFGEMRSDHIHSGIDIKTQGTIGHHVLSIENGFVSRIKVQANGYGKSIYVTHPNGYTSVYGHLNAYRDDIAKFVKTIQYKRRSHKVDLYLEADKFPLKKGDFIAYSGNSGSSSGPHLHFEVRSAADQHPTNVLKYGFGIEDHVAPRFRSVRIYPINKGGHINGSAEKLSISTVKDNGIYTIPWGTNIQASGTLGISVEVFDYLNGAPNRCGVYSLELYVDDQLNYRHVMDEFAFSETRYINAHMDYRERIASGVKAHQLHRLPNNRLRIYDQLVRNGELTIDEERSYHIRIVAKDVAGNESVLEFKISGDVNSRPSEIPGPDIIKTMKYDESNSFDQDQVSVRIPANALYQDLDFTFEKSPAAYGSLSDFFQIAGKETPVHLPYTLSIKTSIKDPAIVNKLLLITCTEKDEVEAVDGEFRNGAVEASLREFGKYAIGIDTIAPEIIPVKGRVTGDLTLQKELNFIIRDNLAGIEKYEGYIDNEWVLFEYDLKNDIITYTFDSALITRNSNHDLEIYISDSKGNVNLFHSTFIW